jgi:hypoxanthine phosphoribosyltransferase
MIVMEKITLKDKTFRISIPYEKISQAIDQVADKINADFRGCEDVPILLCVLNGSIMFMGELMKRLDFNCQIVSTKLTSYEGTSTTGRVKQAMGLTADITGRRVIIVEDIVDTGNTIVELQGILKDAGAVETKICTLLYKPEAYTKDVALDYVAMEIPNEFIVGFGLDYDELGRNFKDIYVLDI